MGDTRATPRAGRLSSCGSVSPGRGSRAVSGVLTGTPSPCPPPARQAPVRLETVAEEHSCEEGAEALRSPLAHRWVGKGRALRNCPQPMAFVPPNGGGQTPCGTRAPGWALAPAWGSSGSYAQGEQSSWLSELRSENHRYPSAISFSSTRSPQIRKGRRLNSGAGKQHSCGPAGASGTFPSSSLLDLSISQPWRTVQTRVSLTGNVPSGWLTVGSAWRIRVNETSPRAEDGESTDTRKLRVPKK